MRPRPDSASTERPGVGHGRLSAARMCCSALAASARTPAHRAFACTPNGQTSAEAHPRRQSLCVPDRESIQFARRWRASRPGGESTVPAAGGRRFAHPADAAELVQRKPRLSRFLAGSASESARAAVRRLGSRDSRFWRLDAWMDAVRVVVLRSFGRSTCGRTPVQPAAFALTLRAPEDDRNASRRLARQHAQGNLACGDDWRTLRVAASGGHTTWLSRLGGSGGSDASGGRGAGHRPALV
jgi:hypothetical protein